MSGAQMSSSTSMGYVEDSRNQCCFMCDLNIQIRRDAGNITIAVFTAEVFVVENHQQLPVTVYDYYDPGIIIMRLSNFMKELYHSHFSFNNRANCDQVLHSTRRGVKYIRDQETDRKQYYIADVLTLYYARCYCFEFGRAASSRQSQRYWSLFA